MATSRNPSTQNQIQYILLDLTYTQLDAFNENKLGRSLDGEAGWRGKLKATVNQAAEQQLVLYYPVSCIMFGTQAGENDTCCFYIEYM